MANGYNISGARAARPRRRNSYFAGSNQADIELRNRQAALGILPSIQSVQNVQNVQTIDVSRNPYAPLWKQRGEPNPSAPRLAPQRPLSPPSLERPLLAIPPPGQGIVTPEWRKERARLAEIAVPYSQEELNKSRLPINDYLSQLERRRAEAVIRPEQPPLSPAEIAPLEQRYAGEFSLIRDLHRRGYGTEAATAMRQLEQRDPRIARHPLSTFLKGEETAKALPKTPIQQFQEKQNISDNAWQTREDAKRAGSREEVKQESQDYLLSLDPDSIFPEELRAKDPSLEKPYKQLLKLKELSTDPNQDLVGLAGQARNLVTPYLQKAAGYYTELGRQAAAQTKENQTRIGRLATTYKSLPTPEERQAFLDNLDPADKSLVLDAYGGMLPQPKPSMPSFSDRKDIAKRITDTKWMIRNKKDFDGNALSDDDITDLKAELTKIENLEKEPTGTAAPAAGRNLPQMATPEDAAKLPSGTRFLDDKGNVRIRP